MTVFDARNSAGLDMSDGTIVNFLDVLDADAGHYSWRTGTTSEPESYVHAYGTGITSDVTTGIATGGAITSLKLDLKRDGDPTTNFNIDAQLTLTVPVQLTALVSPAGTAPSKAADRFWSAMLSGNDRILAPENGNSFLFGDFHSVTADQFGSEDLTGGNDVITAAARAGDVGFGGIGTRSGVGNALVGDAYDVHGSAFNNIAYSARLVGGNDSITLTGRPAYDLIGDAYAVGVLGDVIGGNDSIRSDAVPASPVIFGRIALLIGDVLNNTGDVSGGNDVITGSNYAFSDELLSGDVYISGSAVTGGDDRLNGRGGHDFIAGDVAIAVGRLNGGNDTILGGGDADIIAGDALQLGDKGPFSSSQLNAETFTVIGGNDRLFGEDGDDIIAGDVYAIGTTTTDSTLKGGSDLVHGGNGADTIYGDFGPSFAPIASGFLPVGSNDTLFGDAGDDDIHGGGGNDILVGGSGADHLAGDGGSDSASYAEATTGVFVNLATGFTSGSDAAGDSFETIENLVGSSFADTLVGTAAANILDGAAGGDTLRGGGGNDIYGVNSVGDVVDESVAGSSGSDRIRSSISWNLAVAANNKGAIENLTLGGAAAINGTGNGLANVIVGNGASNLLNGALGMDTLAGGGGADRFAFNAALGAGNIDTITDFSVSGGDVIALENAVFTGLGATTGVLTSSMFASNLTGAAGDLSDRIIYESDTGFLRYDSNGSASGGTILQFASLATGLALTAGDFLVF